MSNVSQKHLKQLHEYMLNKYYVSIEQNNDVNVYVTKSLLNEQQLQQQLQRIYKNANVFVERYNYECKNIIDLLFANTTQHIYMYN